MPVPATINDLSTTVGSNSPAGTETPKDGDNYLRAHASFIASVRDFTNGTTTCTLKAPTITGTPTFSGAGITLTTPTLATPAISSPTISGTATFSGAITGATDLTTTGNTVLGNATGDTLSVGSGGLVKDSVGRVYGNALHNNASGNAGATQYIASGTYTPTTTAVLNISSTSVVGVASWIRVGSVVSVDGQVSIDPNAASTISIVSITLPIASNFAAVSNGNGTAVSMTGAAEHLAGAVYAEDTTDVMWLVFNPGTDTASRPWTYHFQYVVI